MQYTVSWVSVTGRKFHELCGFELSHKRFQAKVMHSYISTYKTGGPAVNI